jgi:predicted O-methyltransferase YrrM
MNDTLEYIAQKFELDLSKKSPIEILKINRKIMAQTLSELNFNLGVEVGTARGEHAKILCENNPNLKLYCVDAWQGYKGYTDYTIDRLDYFYKEAQKTLGNYNCELIRKFSMDAVNDFEDNSLDFVYLDGAHDFKNVAMDIWEWIKKVKVGGILYGHDFKRSSNPRLQQHVKDVVPAYCYALGINPWFVLGTKGRNNGEYQEGTQSWMWVKC